MLEVGKDLPEDVVEQIARVICQAEGKDPDAEITFRGDTLRHKGQKAAKPEPIRIVAWRKYIRHAKKILDEFGVDYVGKSPKRVTSSKDTTDN